MGRLSCGLALFLLACYATAQQPNSKKTDQELIQGRWWINAQESGGKQQSDKAFKGNSFTFRKDKKGSLVAKLDERPYEPVEFAVAIDPNRNPKSIDLTTKGIKARGIYKLDGDDLTICVSLGGQRPNDFTTRPGGDTETFSLRRNRWERYSSLDRNGFAIDFPGKPSETKRDIDYLGNKVDVTLLSVRNEMDRTSYSVMIIPLPGKPDMVEAESAIDGARKSFLAAIDPGSDASLGAERNITNPPAGIEAGREFTITAQNAQSRERSNTRVRVYVTAQHIYILAVTGADDANRGSTVTPFWGSFRTATDRRKDFPSK
jgi:uncharacterized protein (TIGR03067 family)